MTHADSLLIRLRRMTDTDKRSGSLINLARRITRHPEIFTRIRFDQHFSDALQLKDLIPNWWCEFATPADKHISARLLQEKMNELEEIVTKCTDWVSQHIAHRQQKPDAQSFTWGDFHAAVEAVQRFFKHMSLLLTGSSGTVDVSIAFDWEYCLMVPWMKPTRRIAALIKLGKLPSGPKDSDSTSEND